MKKLQTLLALITLSTALTTFAAPEKDAPATAEELLKKFETALKAKDKDAVLQLFDWKDVSAEIRSMHERVTVAMLFRKPVTTIKLAPLPAGQPTEFERNGIRYKPNVTVVGVIDIHFESQGSSSAQVPYGKKDGHFYLANTIQERSTQRGSSN